jgi:hypothetical protein
LQLYDDVIMFRSMIKRAVQEAVPSGYALYAPPSVATREARITFVKDRATSFLKDSEYLMGEPNEQVSDILIHGHYTHLESAEKEA